VRLRREGGGPRRLRPTTRIPRARWRRPRRGERARAREGREEESREAEGGRRSGVEGEEETRSPPLRVRRLKGRERDVRVDRPRLGGMDEGAEEGRETPLPPEGLRVPLDAEDEAGGREFDPSTTPSGANAVATRPWPSAEAAWWWKLLTSTPSTPRRVCSRVPGTIRTRWARPVRGRARSSWLTEVPTSMGMSWTSVPRRATFRTCSPRQIARSGRSRASASRTSFSSNSSRSPLDLVTAGWAASP